MTKVYNKLVRDKIPEIIKADGKKPRTKILEDKEYLAELIKKLGEEVGELEKNLSAEELADIEEVVNEIREALGINEIELENVRLQKAATNGRFKNKIFLESVE